MVKNYILFAAIAAFLLIYMDINAQDQFRIYGEQTLGVRQIDLDTNSSKFNEYRDIQNGLYIQSLSYELFNALNTLYIDLSARDLLLETQSVRARIGDMGNRWNLIYFHNQTPNRISNKSVTPYSYQGNGLFVSQDNVGIGTNSIGTPSLVPTVAQMRVNDSLIAIFVRDHRNLFGLNVERTLNAAEVNFSGLGALKIGAVYSDENREGARITFGTIGDRPPRTLNVQLPEPVEYSTREVHANLEFITGVFQTQLNYLFSTFDNRVESMRWENLFFRPNAGADYIITVPGTPRNVSNFGQKHLAPDNYFHHVSLSAGLNLPFASRFTGTVALGYMFQDMTLLPYSISTLGGDRTPEIGDNLNWNDPNKLPQRTADAEMRTLRIDLDYTINPISRLNLRPFLRYYDLENNTPISNWRYVTQDAAGTTGSVATVNLRRNLAYAHKRMRFGLDARYYFSFWRTSLMAGYTRESIDREFREANTDENIFEASLRIRPAKILSLSGGYLYGTRKADTYNYKVTSQSYWYTLEEAGEEGDNPAFLFADHPDLRRYDVADRKRNELNAAATITPFNNLDLTASYRYNDRDFGSGVVPVAPLAGTLVQLPNPADINAMTPGQQLGLLKDKRQNITINANYSLSERWNIFLFADRENIDLDTRGMYYNEMFRREPSNPALQPPTELGPWTDPNRIYNAATRQTTNTYGAGTVFEILPGKLRFSVDYSLSLTKEDLIYSGYGSDPAFLGRAWETFQFGFDDPADVRFDQYILNASIEYKLLEQLIAGFHYMYSRYYIQDWVQEPEGPWVEQVGSENFLRDITRDNRWGNRLIYMGSYLAPSYLAHVGFVSLTYRF